MGEKLGICWFLLVVLKVGYGTETTVTYNFPTDACSTEPYVVDRNSLVYMKFDGGSIGIRGCRKMEFTTPHSFFYHYRICISIEYFESPDCSIRIEYKELTHYSHYSEDKETIYADSCYSDTYDYDSSFERCMFPDNIASFELKRGGRQKKNRFENEYKGIVDITNTSILQQNRFKFKLYAKTNLDDDVIGALAGGVAGLILLIVIGTCICVKCRKRKRQTGRYCCNVASYNFGKTFRTGGSKEVLSDGCSIQYEDMLLCSCVFCKQHTRQVDSVEAEQLIQHESEFEENFHQK